MQFRLEFPTHASGISHLYGHLGFRDCIAIKKMSGLDVNRVYFLFSRLDVKEVMEQYMRILVKLASNIREQLAARRPAANPYQIAHNLLCRPDYILLFYVGMIEGGEIDELQRLHCEIVAD